MGLFSGLTGHGLLDVVGRLARNRGRPFSPAGLVGEPEGEEMPDRLRLAMDPQRLAMARAVLAGDLDAMSRMTESLRRRGPAEREKARNREFSAFADENRPVLARGPVGIPVADQLRRSGSSLRHFGAGTERTARQHENVHLPSARTHFDGPDVDTQALDRRGHPANIGGPSGAAPFRRLAHQDGFDRQFDHGLSEQVARQTDQDPSEVYRKMRGVSGPQLPEPVARDVGQQIASQAQRAVQQARRASQNAQSGYAPATAIPTRVRDDAEFQREVSRVARRFNLREDDLYRVISFETAGSFDPSQRNLQGSSGTGLIQFLTGGESWARGRGYTRESLSRMSRAEQMALVEQYFADNGLGSIESPTISDIYMTIFTPAAVDEDDDHVLYSEGTSAYQRNSGLDRNGDGEIRKSEAVEDVLDHDIPGIGRYRSSSRRRR